MNRYSLQPGRVILRDGVPFVSLNSYHAHADADEFARRIVEAMDGVTLERKGRVVARSRNLRAILRYRSPVLDVAIYPRPESSALLIVTWSDGTQARAMFASLSVCRRWCIARRSWGFYREMPQAERLSEDDVYKMIRYWRLELRDTFADHVRAHVGNWQWGEIARRIECDHAEMIERGRVF